jgi:hypothetical protein
VAIRNGARKAQSALLREVRLAESGASGVSEPSAFYKLHIGIGFEPELADETSKTASQSHNNFARWREMSVLQ